VDSSVLPAVEYSIGNLPGETYNLNLGLQIDTSHYRYDFTVTVTPVDFTDPNSANNTYTESVEPQMASLALTNASGASIDSVVFRLAGDPSWGDNRLGPGELVLNGQARTWQIPAGTYDLRAYIGQQVLDERLNVGISGTYDWTVLASLDIHNGPGFVIDEVHIQPLGLAGWGPNLLGPGEDIWLWEVHRWKLSPGDYSLEAGRTDNIVVPRAILGVSIKGVCAWFVPDDPSSVGVFQCYP
jgi:hypothetical protein